MGLTGSRGGVEPTRELYGGKVLDCVEDGSDRHEEDPFGKQAFVLWSVCE